MFAEIHRSKLSFAQSPTLFTHKLAYFYVMKSHTSLCRFSWALDLLEERARVACYWLLVADAMLYYMLADGILFKYLIFLIISLFQLIYIT